MPEITREEAKKHFAIWAALYDTPDAAGHEHVRAQFYRLALAALEDAERVDALERDLLECNVVLSEEDGEYEIDRGAAVSPSKGESLRAAIDRARGV